MKKILAIALASLMMFSVLAGCSSAPAGEPAAPDAAAPASGTQASEAAPSEAPASGRIDDILCGTVVSF